MKKHIISVFLTLLLVCMISLPAYAAQEEIPADEGQSDAVVTLIEPEEEAVENEQEIIPEATEPAEKETAEEAVVQDAPIEEGEEASEEPAPEADEGVATEENQNQVESEPEMVPEKEEQVQTKEAVPYTGYVLLLKDTEIYADPECSEVMGSIVEDAYAFTFVEDSSSFEDKIIQVVFDTEEAVAQGQAFITGYVSGNSVVLLSETENTQLSAELETFARLTENGVFVPVISAFEDAEEAVEQEENEPVDVQAQDEEEALFDFGYEETATDVSALETANEEDGEDELLLVDEQNTSETELIEEKEAESVNTDPANDQAVFEENAEIAEENAAIPEESAEISEENVEIPVENSEIPEETIESLEENELVVNEEEEIEEYFDLNTNTDPDITEEEFVFETVEAEGSDEFIIAETEEISAETAEEDDTEIAAQDEFIIAEAEEISAETAEEDDTAIAAQDELFIDEVGLVSREASDEDAWKAAPVISGVEALSSGRVKISWDVDYSDLDGITFAVYEKINGKYTSKGNVTGQTFIILNNVSAKEHIYSVRARKQDASGTTINGSLATDYVANVAFDDWKSSPEISDVEYLGSGKVKITWNTSYTDLKGLTFRVFEKINGKYTTKGNVTEQNSIILNNVSEKEHTYAVRARKENESGEIENGSLSKDYTINIESSEWKSSPEISGAECIASGKVVLTWSTSYSKLDGITFVVYEKINGRYSTKTTVEGQTSVTLNNVSEKEHIYAVRARKLNSNDEIEVGELSKDFTVNVEFNPWKSSPKITEAECLDGSKVKLTWTTSATNLDGISFIVYEKINGKFTTKGTVTGETSIILDNVTEKEHIYVVRARKETTDGVENGDLSQEFTANIQFSSWKDQPVITEALYLGGGKVRITWDTTYTDLDGLTFVIFEKINGKYTTKTTIAGQRSIILNNVTEKEHFYAVRARKENEGGVTENGKLSADAALTFETIQFTEGALTYVVTGNGTVEVSKYEGSDPSVTVPKEVVYEDVTYSVMTIGEAAFADNTSITSVTLPNQITRIGVRAFAGCSNLSTMTCSTD